MDLEILANNALLISKQDPLVKENFSSMLNPDITFDRDSLPA